jgi:hypothetical protein
VFWLIAVAGFIGVGLAYAFTSPQLDRILQRGNLEDAMGRVQGRRDPAGSDEKDGAA